MKTNRIIRRCIRKTCGHVWAREYDGTPKSGNLCRTDESGRRISASDSNEWTCPKCGRWEWVKGGTVNGTVSDHKCGAKCLSAIGPNCECSCGGANHGKNWL
jgi:phage terminase large subunit GpA-like protein